MKKYILNRLKENFDVGEEEEQEGFPDMNYVIGNSSAMDVGEFPTPIDERIGFASMVGGGMMEVQITNPATFTLERDDMISVIDQLGIDITVHSDMNAGYTTAERTSGEAYGYDTVEQYFTDYLQELAAFKKEVERRGEGNKPLFRIGRINPHISTSPLPALSERNARDIAVGPFGYELSDFDEKLFNQRNTEGKNIFKNSDFLRKFYRTFVVREIGENEYRYFERFYTPFSSMFDKFWRDKQNDVLDSMYHQRTGENGSELRDKIDLLSTASMRENVTSRWLEIMAETGFEDEIDNILEQNTQPQINFGPEKLSSLEDLDKFISALSQRYRLSQLRSLPEIYFLLKEGDLTRMATSQTSPRLEDVDLSDFKEQIWDEFEDKMPGALDRLWEAGPRDDEENKVSLISVQGKNQAMVREMEIPKNRVQELTFDRYKDEIRGEIAELFAGEDKEYFDDEEEAEDIHWEEKHRRFLQSFARNFEQQFWMESNIFYRIMPAWLSSSNEDYETSEGEIAHKGWKAPKFIWKTIVVDKWSGKYNIDLENPNPEGEEGYFDALEKEDEFRMDVAAAVGCCYCWAHFTQRDILFDLNGRDFGLTEEEQNEVENKGWTWVDWMNRFGIGVNLETMQGSPQQKLKVWRPKDIAIAAHAINMESRKILEDGSLGGLDEFHKELDGRPAKFTIDMEHVASLGAPPWKEMEYLIEQEEELADEWPELEIDSDKPIEKILRQYHLMDPGVEGQRGTHHGALDRGNTQIYRWLYELVAAGFARNENEPASLLFELAEHKGESSYMMRIMMNMIELGIKPEEVAVENVDPSKDHYSDEKEALIARFFGMDKPNYDREWAKIEEHAFDPLDGLLEAEQFDYTYSGRASLENDNNPQDWNAEEYK